MESPNLAVSDENTEDLIGAEHQRNSSARGTLRGKALRAASWTVAERIFSQGIRLAGNIVLTRLLFPEALGIAATIFLFQELLIMFTDVGTTDVVIQHRDGDTPAFLNTIWTVQVLRGLALTCLAIAISWPVASFWLHDPELGWMLAVSSVQLTISGFVSIKITLMQREMKLGPLAKCNLISQIIGLSILVLLAFILRSAWAMVIGGIISALVQTILSYLVLPGPSTRFGWDCPTLKYLSQIGRWTSVSTILTFVSNRGDGVLMARYLTKAMFGIYNISGNLATVPSLSLQILSGRVLFPLLSQVAREDRSRLSSTYDRVCSIMYLTSLPAIGLLAGMAPAIVQILFDDRYWEAGWITQILTIRAALDCLFAPGKAVLTALGQPRYSALAQMTRALILIAGLPLAFHFFDVAGAALVAASNGVLALVVVYWGLYNNNLFNLKRELKGIAWLIAGGVVGFGLNSLFQLWFH